VRSREFAGGSHEDTLAGALDAIQTDEERGWVRIRLMLFLMLRQMFQYERNNLLGLVILNLSHSLWNLLERKGHRFGLSKSFLKCSPHPLTYHLQKSGLLRSIERLKRHGQAFGTRTRGRWHLSRLVQMLEQSRRRKFMTPRGLYVILSSRSPRITTLQDTIC